MGNPGRVTFYNVICKSADDVPRAAVAIDAIFENSEAATTTETEKAFQAQFVGMLGNVHFLLRSIALACAFAMLCVATNTLAMTARERAHEIAVLKTLGFTPQLVMSLLFAEVTILCGVAALLGAVAAKVLFLFDGPWIAMGAGFLLGFKIPTLLALAALPLGVALGVVAAAVPFVRVAYAPIAPALRRLG
jgi:putative ABC transport system permease protein